MMKLAFKIMALSLLVLLQACFGPKYELDVGDDEERGIRVKATGELIVEPAVIGFESEKGYYFGYRLPKKDVICDWSHEGKSNKFTIAKLDLNPVFFSLDLDTGILNQYTSRLEFKEYLNSLEIDLGDKYMDIKDSSFVRHYEGIYEDYDLSSCSAPKAN